MTDELGFLLEIDDERIEITGVYDADYDIDWVNGNVYGTNEHTAADDPVRGFLTHKCLAFVNVYRKNSDGSIWGIKGIFRKGIWSTAENGMPLYKVWDRLA